VLIVRLLYRNRNQHKAQPASQNKSLYQFMVVMTSLYFFLIFPGIFGMIFKLSWYNLAFLSSNFMIILLAAAIYLLASPQILYGFSWQPTSHELEKAGLIVDVAGEKIDRKKAVPSPLPGPAKKGENGSFAPDKEPEWELRIIQLIQNEMVANQLYLNHRFTIHDLANHTRIPVYQLSPIINRHTGNNFNHWINQFRIEHFLNLVKGGQHQHLTLEALASQSGFNNRITFYQAFKKLKGKTPSEYLHMEMLAP
jgi:AraC-like DNA-binding protein